MDCETDNENEVVKENMSSRANFEVDSQLGEKSVALDCSNRDTQLDQSGGNVENNEGHDGMEGVEYSKTDENGDEVHRSNRETKMDTSFNVRNG